MLSLFTNLEINLLSLIHPHLMYFHWSALYINNIIHRPTSVLLILYLWINLVSFQVDLLGMLALLTAVEDWFWILSRDKSNVGAILFDLSKAFDKVSHSLRLFKLDHCGISRACPAMVRWLPHWSFTICHCPGRHLSSAAESGHFWCSRPQGSILGPLLFVLFTSDLNSIYLNSKFIMYALGLTSFHRYQEM